MEVWLWVVEQEDRARAEVRIGESVPTRAIDVKKVRWSPGLGDDVDRAAGESEVVDLIVLRSSKISTGMMFMGQAVLTSSCGSASRRRLRS